MKRIGTLLAIAVLMFGREAVAEPHTSYSRLCGDTLTMGNGLIERVFRWNGGNLVTIRVEEKQSGRVWINASQTPDFEVVPAEGSV